MIQDRMIDPIEVFEIVKKVKRDPRMNTVVVLEFERWFDKQTPTDQRTIALNAVEWLMKINEVSFSAKEDVLKFQGGEDLRIPF